MTEATETPVDDTTPDDPDGGENGENAVIAKLRKEAKEGAAAKAELAALQRERAFDRAGIPEEGPGKWFRKGYEGDLDPDAIKAAAAQDGLIDTTADTTDPAAADAAAGADRIAAAASDGGSPQVSVDALLAEAADAADVERIMQSAGLGVAPT